MEFNLYGAKLVLPVILDSISKQAGEGYSIPKDAEVADEIVNHKFTEEEINIMLKEVTATYFEPFSPNFRKYLNLLVYSTPVAIITLEVSEAYFSDLYQKYIPTWYHVNFYTDLTNEEVKRHYREPYTKVNNIIVDMDDNKKRQMDLYIIDLLVLELNMKLEHRKSHPTGYDSNNCKDIHKLVCIDNESYTIPEFDEIEGCFFKTKYLGMPCSDCLYTKSCEKFIENKYFKEVRYINLDKDPDWKCKTEGFFPCDTSCLLYDECMDHMRELYNLNDCSECDVYQTLWKRRVISNTDQFVADIKSIMDTDPCDYFNEHLYEYFTRDEPDSFLEAIIPSEEDEGSNKSQKAPKEPPISRGVLVFTKLACLTCANSAKCDTFNAVIKVLERRRKILYPENTEYYFKATPYMDTDFTYYDLPCGEDLWYQLTELWGNFAIEHPKEFQEIADAYNEEAERERDLEYQKDLDYIEHLIELNDFDDEDYTW